MTLLFARLFAFFVLSPFFSRISLNYVARIGFALGTTLVLAASLHFTTHITYPMMGMLVIKEVCLGYLLGTLMALLFEAGALAGQMAGTFAGFSATELLAPQASTTPLMARLFTLTLFALFFTLDLHHLLLKFLLTTVDQLPLTGVTTLASIEKFGHLFAYALRFALIPLTLYFSLLALWAVIARAFRDLPIFFVGYPLQLLLGFVAIALAISLFPTVFETLFYELLRFIRQK